MVSSPWTSLWEPPALYSLHSPTWRHFFCIRLSVKHLICYSMISSGNSWLEPPEDCFHIMLFSWNTILPSIGCFDLFSRISWPFSYLSHHFMSLHLNLDTLNRPSSYSTFICKVWSSVGCLFHSWSQRDLWEQVFQVVFFFKMVLVYSMRASCIDEMHFEYFQYPPHFQLLSDSLLHTRSNSYP